MSKKWTTALMALGFSLFLALSACDQGGGGGQEKGGSPGVSPGERSDRPAPGPGVQEPPPGTQGQQPGTQEQRPGGTTAPRGGATGGDQGGTGSSQPSPQRPPAS